MRTILRNYRKNTRRFMIKQSNMKTRTRLNNARQNRKTQRQNKIPVKFTKLRKLILKDLKITAMSNDLDDPIKSQHLERAEKLFRKYYNKRGSKNKLQAAKYLLLSLLIMSIMFDVNSSSKKTYKVTKIGVSKDGFIPGHLISGYKTKPSKGIKAANQVKAQGHLDSFNLIDKMKTMAMDFDSINLNDIVDLSKKVKYSKDGWLKTTYIFKYTLTSIALLKQAEKSPSLHPNQQIETINSIL